MTFTKIGLHEVGPTTVVLEGGELRGSRVVESKLLTITTSAPIETARYGVMANNLVNLSDEDFKLMQDFDINALELLD